ncbi:Solute carrier family 22 member 1 [Portunus trituberculatus]|uniref:Solute carrier family 22 member 1 n=1 Tax=Portunus trituberculatus TaxID=210409 RepID=A0A5B7G804_PORTR|nr:Solute carrier family 22 member 1 [Portunus trituberculatus]
MVVVNKLTHSRLTAQPNTLLHHLILRRLPCGHVALAQEPKNARNLRYCLDTPRRAASPTVAVSRPGGRSYDAASRDGAGDCSGPYCTALAGPSADSRPPASLISLVLLRHSDSLSTAPLKHSSSHRMVPESLRWLLTRGKMRRAKQVAGQLARHNLLTLPPTAHAQMDHLAAHVYVDLAWESLITLFRTPRLRAHILVTMFMW